MSTPRLRRALAPLFVALLVLLAVPSVQAQSSDPPVTREEDAQALFGRARRGLAALGLAVSRDILLKLRTPDELNVENAGNGGRALEVEGFYRPYNPESIWVVCGMSTSRTLGVLAHELTHAWQSDNAPLQDRKLKEGFARWVQYHVLRNEGFVAEALALTRSGDDDYRGGLLALLEIEKQRQVRGVIELARTAQKL